LQTHSTDILRTPTKSCKSDSYTRFDPVKNVYFDPLPERDPRKVKAVLGLSKYDYLHAKISFRIFQNSEILAFAGKNYEAISGNFALNDSELMQKRIWEDIKKENKKKEKEISWDYESPGFNKEGFLLLEDYAREQKGLTGLAKRYIRICSYKYNELVQTYDWKRANIKNKAYCSFSTLTFRRIYPDTSKEAKQIFRAWLMRLARANKNTPLHYIWVAELQTGKYLKGAKTYRLKNREEVLHFHILSPHYIDKYWLNESWNDTCINHFKKSGKITEHQAKIWREESTKQNEYNRRLERYRNKQTTREPRKPPKSKYLLLPNVRAVYNASRYMSKYMSKAGGIKGHLWGISKESRQFLKYIQVDLLHKNSITASDCLKQIHDIYKKCYPKVFTRSWLNYDDSRGIWIAPIKKPEEDLRLLLANLIQHAKFNINGDIKQKTSTQENRNKPRVQPENFSNFNTKRRFKDCPF